VPVGEQLQVTHVLSLGDNFYPEGIHGNSHSERFDQTWNNVYTADSLMVPWLVNAGNHDHLGNVDAQISYTSISDRWVFPSRYHKHTISSDDHNVTVDIILMDAIDYTGVDGGDGSDYPSSVQDHAQQKWLEESLQDSVADYIIVGSHYPIYSVCDHGNTRTLVNNLKPLLEKYNAHLMSGHDHCAEHIVEQGVSYWVNGMGHGCW
jgi:tartrate-resistant acid phosphatase type 5